MRTNKRETTKRGDAIEEVATDIYRMSSGQYLSPGRQTLLHKINGEYI
jgi:hypothetical protein